MKKIICLTLCVLLVLSCCACSPAAKWGENYKPENEIADQSNLYGVCYITPPEARILAKDSYDPEKDRNDPEKVFQIMENMGVTSMRYWLHMSHVLIDPETVNEEGAKEHHELLALAKKHGIQVIGMNHNNYKEGVGFEGWAKHEYQPEKGSDYYKWLEDYETSWYTLVKEFPEVTYWEIDNEINNPGFMYIEGKENYYLPVDEMVAIGLDMMFYASRGIHRANPDAITVMASLTDPTGIGKPYRVNTVDEGWVTYPKMSEFFELMYKAIKTGKHGSRHADDFFQTACWHPYYWEASCSNQYWIDENNKMYDLIKKYEGKDKKVFLTEIGWVIGQISEQNQAKWLPQLYETVKNEMPYVEAVHYFRMFDNLIQDNQLMGLFYDHNELVSYDQFRFTGGEHGAPRPAAYAFQEMTGASGSLTLLIE